jgi:hypothetical protein
MPSNNSGDYTCQLCGYQAIQKTNIKLHQQAVHNGKRCQCPECEYQPTKKDDLVKHQKYLHMGHKFQCSIQLSISIQYKHTPS